MSYWSRSFPGLAEYLAEVRQFTQMVLGDAPGRDLVVLAVSELAGNAIVHTASGEPGGQFVVHIAAFVDRWKVRVDDEGSPSEPHVIVEVMDLDEAFQAEAGRGLAMVAAVSQDWGVLGDKYARAVWAEIPYPFRTDADIDSVLESLEAAADAVADESQPPYKDVDPPPEMAAATIPAARWPGVVPTDLARAARFRRVAIDAVFMRALIENAYAETIGPRPLPCWPPFPNPFALQGIVRTNSSARRPTGGSLQEAG